MKKNTLNEQVHQMRKMMGLNEFFSTPGEREGLPEPTEDMPTVAENDNEKYAKTIQGIQKYGARPYAIKLVDAYLNKMVGMSASDRGDTAIYAKGLDAIEKHLLNRGYKMAYQKAKNTATAMLKDEGFGSGMFEESNTNLEAQKCSECGAGYMREGVCDECGYKTEEPMEEDDFYGIGKIPNMNGKDRKNFTDTLVGDKSKKIKQNELKFFIDKLREVKPEGVTPEEAVERAREFEYINTDNRGNENRADFIILMTQLANAGLLISKKTGKKITPEQMQGFINKTHTVAQQAYDTMGVNETKTPVKEYNKKMMGNMEKQYGKKKGKEIYYATVNKNNLNPETGKKKK